MIVGEKFLGMILLLKGGGGSIDMLLLSKGEFIGNGGEGDQTWHTANLLTRGNTSSSSVTLHCT